MTIFIELSIIVVIATLISFLMRFLRQPLIVGYILTGIVVGPYLLNIVHSSEYIELFSKIGISILLFIVGLSMNPDVIKEVGKVSTITGLGQFIFTAFIGFFILIALGFDSTASIFATVALTFSSTIIILKLLSDKGDVDKLYGRISIGFLLVQDLIATIFLVVVSTVSLTQGDVESVLLILFLKGIGVAIALYCISKFVLPHLSRIFATSQELLFLFSISWGLGLAALFYTFGFSIEIGALIAGATLSVSPFAIEIGSRLKPLRDFFIVLFFILLGSQIILTDVSSLLVPVITLSLFVLIGNPLIMFVLMNLLGYRRKLSFLVGLTVAQISEFSLILMSLAFSLGHVSQEIVSLVILVGIITITGSSYFILYADSIYPRIEWFLKLIEIRRGKNRERNSGVNDHEVIIFGYDRVGDEFVQAASNLEKKFIVVDFNPSSISKLQEKNIPFKYGDAEDVEFLQELNLKSVKLVVSTIPDFKTTMLLVKAYRQVNPDGIIIVISHGVEHTKLLYLAGASYVVMPHYLGARYAANMISRHGLDIAEFERERNIHLQKLAKK